MGSEMCIRDSGNGAAGAGDASGGGEALGFELVDTTAEPPSRFAVQRAMDGADSVLFCLVDGERREWCLDEQAARRWVEGAGGPTPPPDGVPSLPVPVKVENVAGRLLLVASAHGTNRAGALRAEPRPIAARRTRRVRLRIRPGGGRQPARVPSPRLFAVADHRARDSRPPPPNRTARCAQV